MMSDYDAAAASNMLYGHTYEGVWQRYNVPTSQRWIWTLSSSKAIVVFGFFALLLAFSQSRLWRLIRHCIYLRNKVVRLDDNKPNPLEQLSQAQAIAELIPLVAYYLTRLRGAVRAVFCLKQEPEAADKSAKPDSPIISPWFGMFALFNLALFGVMGVALPVLLSEGALGAPVVRSKYEGNCPWVIDPGKNHEANLVQQSVRTRTDAIFDVCLNRSDQGCGSQYYIRQPQITKASTSCPFSQHICYDTPNATNSFEITRANITAYELGVNSPSELSLSHRLACAPIRLENFLVLNSQDTPHPSVNISILDPELVGDIGMTNSLRETFWKPLQTMNEPNSFSSESSGLRMALEDGKQDLTILPTSFGPNSPPLIHKDLKRGDAEIFLIIRRPGSSSVAGPSLFVPENDPFFARHTRCGDQCRVFGRQPTRGSYVPDTEATALGCVEQLQFCVSAEGPCTSWEAYSAELLQKFKSLLPQEQLELSQEPWLLLGSIPAYLSISYYFRSGKTPELSTEGDVFKSLNVDKTKEQWVTEVDIWFMRRILQGILATQSLARDATLVWSRWSLFSKDTEAMKYAFCKDGALRGGILFRDPDFTNINWIGFWITNVLLTMICIASYTIERIEKGVRAMRVALSNLKKYLWEKLLLAGKGLKAKTPNALFTKGTVDFWA